MTYRPQVAPRLLGALLLAASGTCAAQLSSPNAAGVAMGHVHYAVRDVEANRKFWLALGGEAVTHGRRELRA